MGVKSEVGIDTLLQTDFTMHSTLVLFATMFFSMGLSWILCALGRALFSWFRSEERKFGVFRRDQPAGGRELRTIELPLIGGTAIVLAIIPIIIGAGIILGFNQNKWILTSILLLSLVGFLLVGFMDDWGKVHRGQGLSEKQKFIGVVIVSAIVAIALNRLVPSARFSYSPYKEFPLLGYILVHIHFAWVAFFILLTASVTSTTSLSVDFSDGLDGLAGGLLFSAFIAFAIVILGQSADNITSPLVMLTLACAGALLGFLPWNWPSAWAARGRGRGGIARKARIYMGDSGALALGGTLAVITIVSRTELFLLFIGALFVLEGTSVLISARLLTKFFRKYISVIRYTGTDLFVPHTEFPLPFLATPLHHHFDLLGWNRRQLVFGAWALGAIFAILGIMSGIAPFTWERYLARFIIIIIAGLIWQSGTWTRRYFVGLYPLGHKEARLSLFYGYPYSIGKIKLYKHVEAVDVGCEALNSPTEIEGLWQRMNIFDARASLGYYCYRAGYYTTALTQWELIPERNLKLRPEIFKLFEEVRERIAIEKEATQPLRVSDLKQHLAKLNGTSGNSPVNGNGHKGLLKKNSLSSIHSQKEDREK